MTNAFLQSALRRAQAKKNKKQNGFTLIELMVVVAIVGVLTAVGLPELTKAQNKAKDTAASATLTNAAKECSLSLITLGDDTEYTGGVADSNFEDVVGSCGVDEKLGIASTGNEDGFQIQLSGSIPGSPEPATAAELTAIAG